MARALIAAAAAALIAIPGVAAAQTPGPHSGERADITFATHGGIRTFTPARDRNGVYIQDSHRNWYYASFFMRCENIDTAFNVGFKTFGGQSSLSRGDTIYAGDERCRIADLVRSGPPPERKSRKKNKAS